MSRHKLGSALICTTIYLQHFARRGLNARLAGSKARRFVTISLGSIPGLKLNRKKQNNSALIGGGTMISLKIIEFTLRPST